MQEDDFSPVVLGNQPEEEEKVQKESELVDEMEPEEPKPEPEENPEKREKKPKKTKRQKLTSRAKRKIAIAIAGAAGLIVVAYLGGAAYYSSHFFYGTTVNGFDCSNMNIDQARQTIMDGIVGYTYSLYERDGAVESISGAEIGMKLETIGDLGEAKNNQNPFTWPFADDSRHQSVNIIVSMDEDALYQRVQSLNCVTQTRSEVESAASFVTYDEEQQCFVLTDPDSETESGMPVFATQESQPSDFSGVQRQRMNFSDKNIVNVGRLFDCVKTGMYGLYPDMSLEIENCYISMEEESSVKQALDTMNKYISASVSYQNGDEIIPLDRGSIHFWVSVDSSYNVYLDEAQVEQFVIDLAAKYNTIGSSRTFISSSGGEVTVYGGDYGWRVDVSDETQALCEIIRNGETTTREPIYSQKAASHGNVDFGNTYVEISIGGQHLWFYKDGQLIVSSDMVSGNPNAGNGTPGGLYMLKYKERNATLVGEDYRTPVSFWMPFNGGIGMHDATWRSSFGGSIYIGGGSHGCINLPYSVAETIYANIEAGDPVVVY